MMAKYVFILYTRSLLNERLKPVFSTKLPFKFVFLHCEFTKVILLLKGGEKLFILKLSGIR